MLDRINILKEYILNEPENPFNHYALAMEYSGNCKKDAQIILEMLIAKHPSYLATYYQLAALYVYFGENELAKKIYIEGISIAQIQSNEKTLKELKGAYQMLLDEEMD